MVEFAPAFAKESFNLPFLVQPFDGGFPVDRFASGAVYSCRQLLIRLKLGFRDRLGSQDEYRGTKVGEDGGVERNGSFGGNNDAEWGRAIRSLFWMRLEGQCSTLF